MGGAGSDEPSAGQAVWTPQWGRKAVEQRACPGNSLPIAAMVASVLFAEPLAQVVGLSAASCCHAGLAAEFRMEMVAFCLFALLALQQNPWSWKIL